MMEVIESLMSHSEQTELLKSSAEILWSNEKTLSLAELQALYGEYRVLSATWLHPYREAWGRQLNASGLFQQQAQKRLVRVVKKKTR